MDIDKITFRCSSLSNIMTEPQRKADALSKTCITHLIDVYIANKYKRYTDTESKYTKKGLMVEEDSITLYSRVTKKFVQKNEERIFNDWIQGLPDIYEGESIEKATLIRDIKSSWDIYTFFRVQLEEIKSAYYWQLQGYMDLTGAKQATLNYCLINTPDVIINDEKRRLQWKMGIIDTTKDFELACKEIERNMTFDDIPLENRHYEIKVERNDEDIARMHDRVLLCRDYMKTFKF